MTKYNHLYTLKSVLYLSRKNKFHDTCLKMIKKTLFKEATTEWGFVIKEKDQVQNTTKTNRDL